MPFKSCLLNSCVHIASSAIHYTVYDKPEATSAGKDVPDATLPPGRKNSSTLLSTIWCKIYDKSLKLHTCVNYTNIMMIKRRWQRWVIVEDMKPFKHTDTI